jgi:hypothetical protein
MRIRSLLRVVPILLLSTASAFSAPLTITFASSLLPAGRGQTVTFTATVLNTTAAPVFLNADALNITAPLTGNDTKFFLNFPISLAAGGTVTAPAFDISVPLNAPFALYPGEFDILGGSNANAQTTVGTATFAVNVVSPEPGTFGSAIVGLGCVIVFLRRNRRGIRS